MERGTEEAAEHGLGAGASIFRPTRVRPLLRFEVGISPRTKVVPRSKTLALALQGRFSFLGGIIMYQTIADIQAEKRVLKQNILNKKIQIQCFIAEYLFKVKLTNEYNGNLSSL